MESPNAMAMIHALQHILNKCNEEAARRGRHTSVNPDVRLALPSTHCPVEQVPIVLKGSGDWIWITAHDADGNLPPEVEEDLGLSSETLNELDELDAPGWF
ncbi:hypothetical protein [Streptomyces sp. MP131-18]|uniref:hypothetical protein n=1 Tax=Streptomyces sp. MP131-18 TaxID=1857892 RepID=UPI0009CB52CF|nr:hypothetical protein [Streptomyces sp. MP131-18]ONK13236.1 hypothetical protein STBA_39990 [Streptomyces sp. MP131-18]